MRNSITNLSAFTFPNSAEASEVTTITDNSIPREHTVSVISAETSTFMDRLLSVVAVIFLLIFIFSGLWIPVLILGLLWAVVKYVLFGE